MCKFTASKCSARSTPVHSCRGLTPQLHVSLSLFCPCFALVTPSVCKLFTANVVDAMSHPLSLAHAHSMHEEVHSTHQKAYQAYVSDCTVTGCFASCMYSHHHIIPYATLSHTRQPPRAVLGPMQTTGKHWRRLKGQSGELWEAKLGAKASEHNMRKQKTHDYHNQACRLLQPCCVLYGLHTFSSSSLRM